MTTALLGLLSTIFPIVLDLICDRISDDKKIRQKGKSDVKKLHLVNDASGVATVFARHDARVRRLLLRAKARRLHSK